MAAMATISSRMITMMTSTMMMTITTTMGTTTSPDR
jgi:hypothetical protein